MKTVLLVDDDIALREVFTIKLERAGFKVTSSENGRKALAEFSTRLSEFDCVMTDHDMPEMSGLEFIQALRQASYTRPIVMLSGTMDLEVPSKVEAMNAKFFDKLKVKDAIQSLAGVETENK